MRNKIFALYVSACYLAIIVGGAFVDELCYERLYENRNPVEATTKIKDNSKLPASRDIKILESGPTRYSSKITNKIMLALPAFGLFSLILLIREIHKWKKLRGFLILFSFASICILVHIIMNYTRGLRFYISTSVLMSCFFYGALFWFIDSFYEPVKFDSLLDSVVSNNTGIEKRERLKLLYDVIKDNLTLVSTFFLGVCIVMVFNISIIIKDQYSSEGLSSILTMWSIWLTFWGSLGLLGYIGSELGRQISQVVNALK
jgi:hypothetical protein